MKRVCCIALDGKIDVITIDRSLTSEGRKNAFLPRPHFTDSTTVWSKRTAQSADSDGDKQTLVGRAATKVSRPSEVAKMSAQPLVNQCGGWRVYEPAEV